MPDTNSNPDVAADAAGTPVQPAPQAATTPGTPPPAKTGTIAGVVCDKEKKALAGATVFARSGVITAEPVLSGDDGAYELTNLKPGEWEVFAWHKESTSGGSAAATVVAGQAAAADIVAEGGVAELEASGTVFYRYTEKAVARAMVKATRKPVKGVTGTSIPLHAMADASGDFTLKGLEPGTWSFTAFDDKSMLAATEEQTIWRSTGKLRLQVWREMTKDDWRIGWWFFGALIAGLLLLAIGYTLAHSWSQRGAEDMSDVLITVTDQILTSSKPLTVTAGLTATIGSLRNTWETVASTVTSLSDDDKAMFGQVVADVEQAFADGKMPVLEQRVRALNTLAKSGFFSSLFWTQEPLRYAEVLLWALAGVLINLIMTVGSYLRWQRFYREGIPMHLSHIVAIPVLALVFVLLLAQVSVKLSIAGTNDVQINLTDPRVLAAVAFLVGSRPWALWEFIQERAAKLTG